MLFKDVAQVLDALDKSHVRHWVAGGWGVAALVGHQTREHRDLDLAVDASDLAACLQALDDLGFATETDWLPVRIELRASVDRWVDVHPVVLDTNGHGRQAGLDGAHFDYPPSAFTAGRVNDRRVACLSIQQQRDFHTGYEHKDKDTHDLAQLDALERLVRIPETIAVGPITLQRWTIDRADDMDRAVGESLPELTPFMAWATPCHNLDSAKGYIERSHNEWERGENFNFAMLTAEGQVVGSVGLMGRQGPGVLEIGYWVHSDHAGNGYATAAVSALAELGLAQPGIDRMEIYHDPGNPASGRVAAKAGFHEAGRIAREKQAPADTGTDVIWARRRSGTP